MVSPMDIVQITPGAGGMYCGNCFRDNALVAALSRAGHTAHMIPLYLPLTLEEEDQSRGTPIFFSGVNVYLEQAFPIFRFAPGWLHHWLASPWLLKRLASRAGSTHPSKLGPITLSMVQGEEGRQARELTELVDWMGQRPRPDVICLSNALLLGMARELKRRLGVPVACMLQGEDYFLDALLPPWRERCWAALSERAREVDRFIAPSRYFAELMGRRLGLDPARIEVVPNGINLDGYAGSPQAHEPPTDDRPVLGYFARMCREKGLDVLVEAFIRIRRRGRVPGLRLRVGGGCGPSDLPGVRALQNRLRAEGLADDVSFHANLDRAQKIDLLRSFSVMSVPAAYGEAFGLYVIEALAAGVPVVQPAVAAFPELIEATGGGVLAPSAGADAMAEAIESLLLDPERRRQLGEAGRRRVREAYSVECMRDAMVAAYAKMLDAAERPAQSPHARG